MFICMLACVYMTAADERIKFFLFPYPSRSLLDYEYVLVAVVMVDVVIVYVYILRCCCLTSFNNFPIIIIMKTF